jgi:SAM-dependent methyltransferase
VLERDGIAVPPGAADDVPAFPSAGAAAAGTTSRTAAPALAILDIGCGVGAFLTSLARFGRVTGLELDEPSIAFCREHGFPLTAVAGSDHLPVPAASQDLLCLWDVLEHTPDDRAVLAEMLRCLKPGGHLAISVPSYQFLYANNDRVAHHFRRYTRGDLVRKLRQAGFEVRKATYVNCVLGLAIVPTVLAIKAREKLLHIPYGTKNNLDVPAPGPLNALFAGIFGGERHVLRHVSSPFGHSLFVVARRPPAGAPDRR